MSFDPSTLAAELAPPFAALLNQRREALIAELPPLGRFIARGALTWLAGHAGWVLRIALDLFAWKLAPITLGDLAELLAGFAKLRAGSPDAGAALRAAAAKSPSEA